MVGEGLRASIGSLSSAHAELARRPPWGAYVR